MLTMTATSVVALAVASLLFMIVSTIFTLFFSTASFEHHAPSATLAVIAAALDLVDLACLVYILFRSGRILRNNTSPWMPASFFWVILVSFVGAHVATVALLVWVHVMSTNSPPGILLDNTLPFLYISWGLCGASLFTHSSFLIISRWSSHKRDRNLVDVDDDLSAHYIPDSCKPNNMAGSRPIQLQSTPPRLTHEYQRSAIPEMIHSDSSRTRLLKSPSWTETEWAQSARNSSEFGSPATIPEASPVMPMRSFAARPSTPVRQRLEPIPGSQPNSPGRPLDLAQRGSEDNSTPKSSQSEDPAATSPQSFEQDAPLAPPRFRSASVTSRPASPAVDESFIHPLFRSDSPLPPPTPTFSTTVTASALGGRAMSRESFQRASSRSRPSSPALVGVESHVHRDRAWSTDTDLRPFVARSKSLGAAQSRPATSDSADDVPPIPPASTTGPSGLGISSNTITP